MTTSELQKLIKEEIQSILKEETPTKTLQPGLYRLQQTEDGRSWTNTTTLVQISISMEKTAALKATLHKIGKERDMEYTQFYNLARYKAPNFTTIILNASDIK